MTPLEPLPDPPPDPPGVEAVHAREVVAAAGGGDGVAWSLERAGDLNVNVVHLGPGSGIATHRNDEVDVAILVVDGTGVVEVDGHPVPLSAARLAVVAKGAVRTITAGQDGLTYVTVHRRRGPLSLGRRRSD